MNNYNYTAFVNDYVFLEEMGRKAAGWGREIQEKKLTGQGVPLKGDSNAHRGRGSMRGGNRGGSRGRTKRELLKDVLLERADIDMQLCPEGMERKKMNQSSWDAKCVISSMVAFKMYSRSLGRSNTGYLTVQYRFYYVTESEKSSQDRYSRAGVKRKRILDDPAREVYTVLTHRNNIELPINDSLHRMIQERRKKDTNLPSWVDAILTTNEKPSTDEVQNHERTKEGYVVLIRGSNGALPKGVDQTYEQVDPALPLVDALKGHTFAEFPSFEVVREQDWNLDTHEWDREGSDEDESDEDGEERRIKKLKIDEEGGKKLLGGLMVYGEEEDEEGAGSDNTPATATTATAKETKPTGLLGMLDYSSESSEASDSEDGDDTIALDATRILKAQLIGNEEEVDWDDDDD